MLNKCSLILIFGTKKLVIFSSPNIGLFLSGYSAAWPGVGPVPHHPPAVLEAGGGQAEGGAGQAGQQPRTRLSRIRAYLLQGNNRDTYILTHRDKQREMIPTLIDCGGLFTKVF